jgi:uncharacterized membrane protein HdeD (DUF308 family)|tara:strand:+ start:1935 stop:2573 length:639 start_codon:yes stop_codon:yes gene_type:complete
MSKTVNTKEAHWLSVLESTITLKRVILKPIKITISHWLMPLTSGIIIILTGILWLVIPAENYSTLTLFLGFIILISGLGESTFALIRSKKIKGWGWFFTGGNIDILSGLFFLYFSDSTLYLLSVYVACRLLFKSTLAIGVLSKQQFPNDFPWSSLMLFVAVTKGLAFFVLLWSILDGNNGMPSVAIFFIMLGVIRIIMALGLKKIHNKISNS